MDGVAPPVVFVLRLVDDGVNRGEASPMARRRRRTRPGVVARSGRSASGQWQAPAKDGRIDLAAGKFGEGVRGVHKVTGKEMVVTGRSGGGSRRRKQGRGGGGSGNSGV